MRSALIAFAVVVFVGVLALAATGARTGTKRVQTLGVRPVVSLAPLPAAAELCEGPIALADDVEGVAFYVASIAAVGPPITVRVKDEGGLTLRSGRLPSTLGLDARRPQVVRFPRLKGERYVRLCFLNRGPAVVKIFGDRLGGPPECTSSGSRVWQMPICRPAGVRPTLTNADATVDGVMIDGDVAADFVRDEPRSRLSLIPQMTRRASRFRPAFVSPGLWWAFLAAWLVLVPGAVVVALARSLSEPGRAREPRSPGSRRAT